MASSIRTLSQLPEISSNSLLENAYFETSIPIGVSVDLSGNSLGNTYFKYASRKIQNKELRTNINNYVRLRLSQQTGISSQNFGKMYDDYSDLISGEFTLGGTKTFVENPIILKDALSDFNVPTNYSVSLSALKRYTNINASPAIGSYFGFVTTLSSDTGSPRNETLYNIDTQNKVIYDSPRYVFSPESAKIISENEYVFKIKPGERKSDAWVAPATGIFTCYGWLDEINNDSVSNEKRWVALLGYQEDLGVWTTLQVQPFIKNNYLSYVGFTFPVHKGLKLMVQTGFAVGNNSDKYFRSSSSLANHQANAFLGGVYTGLSVDFDNLPKGNYSVCSDPNINLLSTMLIELSGHENSCDLCVDKRLDNLENRLVTNDVVQTVQELSTQINNRVRYVDAVNYKSTNRSHTPCVRTASLCWGNGRKLSTGGCAGVWATGLSGPTLQGSYREDLGEYSAYQALQVNWSDSTFGMIREYLPEYATPREHDRTLYHPRDFVLSYIPNGAIFSDGIYLYYKVSQDSTVILRPGRDPTNRASECVNVWLLCGSNNVTRYTQLTAVHLVSQVDDYSGQGPERPISVPLKKGSIIAVGMYFRQRVYDYNTYDIFVQPPFTAQSMTTTFANILTGPDYLKRSTSFDGHTLSADKNGKPVWAKHTQMATTYRMNVDFSNKQNIYDLTANTNKEASNGKWAWKEISADYSCGELLQIIELP